MKQWISSFEYNQLLMYGGLLCCLLQRHLKIAVTFQVQVHSSCAPRVAWVYGEAQYCSTFFVNSFYPAENTLTILFHQPSVLVTQNFCVRIICGDSIVGQIPYGRKRCLVKCDLLAQKLKTLWVEDFHEQPKGPFAITTTRVKPRA